MSVGTGRGAPCDGVAEGVRMRIKQIELNGFKSFMDRTVLELPAGVTAIVGPNGCGKSNIVDAIRWVLGEQSPKHLRGGAMEDVIFTGNAEHGPLGHGRGLAAARADRRGLAPGGRERRRAARRPGEPAARAGAGEPRSSSRGATSAPASRSTSSTRRRAG